MIGAVVGMPVGLDLRDPKPNTPAPDLLPKQIPSDLQSIARIELSRQETTRHGGSLAQWQGQRQWQFLSWWSRNPLANLHIVIRIAERLAIHGDHFVAAVMSADTHEA